jgi:signal transduction histidine kinase
MLASVLTRGSDPRRLRILLALLFLGLAVPTGFVAWQAYGRLKWEAFHQYRSQAEELTGRVDREIGERIVAAEGRSFADFAFFYRAGGAGVLQRSPLSAYPVEPLLPGLIGYFQVDANGILTTPLLPDAGTDPAAVGIEPGEFAARRALSREISRILADNRLVGDRAVAAASGPAEMQAAPPAAPAIAGAMAPEGEEAQEAPEARPGAEAASRQESEFRAGRRLESDSRDVDASYAQQRFDQLNQEPRAAGPTSLENEAEPGPVGQASRRANVYGKVQDLRLDDALNRKSEILEQADGGLAKASADELRITAFESELDPFEFSLLDSGHFVLFRKVWRNGERYIQGALIEQRAFLDQVIESAFRVTALSGMSDLVVAYRDDVIGVLAARGQRGYAVEASGMEGALLYRSRLSTPLDMLELIYSVKRLPPGPGAAVLGWSTLLLAAVFLGGFYALYRLGMSQIALARQQQDFVSAVSHELKTPLTSIRMYGEMLKEGWADEGRRQQYYAYIHDESERLTRLIDNVLRLASITRNGLHLDLQVMAAGALAEHMRAKLADSVERAGFELTFAVAADACNRELQVDEDCFTQIFINLVDNAIKFSRKAETRRIDVAVAPAGGARLRFSVRDYGPGVPRDQMKNIFRLFYRTESELTRETVGTGIGLAIVHQLATAMSGRVDVVNREPGAEFRVSFPIASEKT